MSEAEDSDSLTTTTDSEDFDPKGHVHPGLKNDRSKPACYCHRVPYLPIIPLWVPFISLFTTRGPNVSIVLFFRASRGAKVES